MAPAQLQHRRTHNLLLIKKLLDCRDNASPFTLVIDSLAQGARHLLREVIVRGKKSKTRTIYLSFETLKIPTGVDVSVPAHSLDVQGLQRELSRHLKDPQQRSILIFDSLNIFLHYPSVSPELPSILSSLISPSTSLVAVYHSDVPVPHDATSYSPSSLTLLKYLATTIITTHSLTHVLAAKQARQRSLAEPVFGLAEEKEGIIVGLGSNDRRGTVIEMEYRRKSGRAVHELFFLPRRRSKATDSLQGKGAFIENIMLLDDHPRYKVAGAEGFDLTSPGAGEGEGIDSTFNLGLTERQRRDREGVVLPYFDAQNEGGVGEGGRILYEMGVEDDFDEEEDEI
ncbi:hypothetical protein NA57DRAFT_77322 [Rhizodiscina lignyota]|uniref:Elongator complex protein 5 n=1 Tax=Rhizodiscina lignyota TaxID=1504668 RepID=A0A9P4IDL5_9PEZI|nr:hypothetical protein NA57DRAFT_77322 [Rhizodiscina lignyota]